jgi:5'-deoxynucleotidase YfbR-like HD superfamily hydrolase
MKKKPSPITIVDFSKEKPLVSKQARLNAISNFIINSFNANFNFRFRNEPFMKKSFEDGRRESIAGHMWGVALLWLTVRDYCPNLAKIVNSEKILEILLYHDLGEIIRGDTSIYEQLNAQNDKKHVEREDLQKIIKDLPASFQKKLLYYFDHFEDTGKTRDLEILIARLMDSLHGSFFVFAHSDEDFELEELQNKLAGKHFGRVVGYLFKFLDQKKKKKAKEEIVAILKDHIELWKKAGIEIKPETYFS